MGLLAQGCRLIVLVEPAVAVHDLPVTVKDRARDLPPPEVVEQSLVTRTMAGVLSMMAVEAHDPS